MIENKLYKILDDLDIKYEVYEHEAIYTIEEAKNLDIKIPGQKVKNLFLKNRKGDKHYLMILDEEKIVNLKLLSKEIESTALSFASEERLEKYLKLKPGSVSPFGIINDEDKDVIILIDSDLKRDEKLGFHPNLNTSTLVLDYLDFEKFLHSQGNIFKYVDIRKEM